MLSNKNSKAITFRFLCNMTFLIFMLFPSAVLAQPLSRLDHIFVYDGNDEESSNHIQVLKNAALELSPILRPIGRRILNKYLRIPQFIAIKSSGDSLSITVEPNPPRRSKLDGTPSVIMSVSGEPGTIRRVATKRSITETIVTGQNRRIIVYTFDESYEFLTLQWSVKLPRHFSRPICYNLSYRNQPGLAQRTQPVNP